MVKPEWGTKRTCPKCGVRFYDLGKEEPVECIDCGNQWHPEPVLKSKQPLPFEASNDKKKEDSDLAADNDLDINVDEVDSQDSPDNDVDLGGDEDLGVTKSDDDVNKDEN